MKDWVNISQRLIMLGQLGLSLMMPLTNMKAASR